MKNADTQIPYDAQCPHGNYYSDCQICSGAKADFERACYLLADDWFDGECDIGQP